MSSAHFPSVIAMSVLFVRDNQIVAQTISNHVLLVIIYKYILMGNGLDKPSVTQYTQGLC